MEKPSPNPDPVITFFSFDTNLLDQKVIFRPNPGPQEEFLAAPERQALYGGAAGGGKSYGILADAARDLHHPQFSGLIVRKTTEELRELIRKSQELYIPLGFKWSERRSSWKSPAGGELWLSFLERDQDVTRYQGQAFNYIAFDELTQWATPYAWNYMSSRLRTTSGSGLKLYMRATTNPGGVGHLWVKKMFIDPAPPGQSFWATDIDTGEILVEPEYRYIAGIQVKNPDAGRPLFKRRFIPAHLSDNPYLFNDGEYEKMLLSLPENERKRLLEGNWDIAEGAAFTEWDRNIHVVDPFPIPHNWRRFRACDYGYGSFSAVLWFAVTPWDQLVVYRELYISKCLAKDLAQKIYEIELEDSVSYGVLDASTWWVKGDSGPPIAEQLSSYGIRWRPSDRSKGSRVSGKNEIHRRLQVDEYTGAPGLVFFNTCRNAIAQIPVLPIDKNNPEDVDTNAEDHIYDALRYGIMSRPRNRSINVGEPFTPVDSVFGY